MCNYDVSIGFHDYRGERRRHLRLDMDHNIILAEIVRDWQLSFSYKLLWVIHTHVIIEIRASDRLLGYSARTFRTSKPSHQHCLRVGDTVITQITGSHPSSGIPWRKPGSCVMKSDDVSG